MEFKEEKVFPFTLTAFDGAPTTFKIVSKDKDEAIKNLIKSFKGYITQLEKAE